MQGAIKLNGSKQEDIDCIIETDKEDVDRAKASLDCYVTYRDTIEETGIKTFIIRQVTFEIFGEDFKPPLGDIFDKLP
ncbi:hypothetical protein ACFL5H_03115 [Candidatus Latescibacterota bacterium]